MARAPITSKSQVIAEIQTIYKSQGVREMRLLDHAKALDKAAKPRKDANKSQQLRNTLGRLVSDYFERAQFRPLTSQQKKQFSFPTSAPDAIASLEEIAEYLPQGVADSFLPTLTTKQFEGEGALAPVEIKQILGGGAAATTATQATATLSRDQFSDVFGLTSEERGLLTPGADLGKKDLRSQFNTAFSAASFTDWMFSGQGAAEAYKKDAVTQLDEKISNYEMINWKDKMKSDMGGRFPTFYVVPGSDKILNIKNEQNFRKYISVSPNKNRTKVDLDGNVSIVVQFKISSQASKKLEENAVNITKRVHDKLARVGSSQLMNYFAMQAGRKKYDIDYLIEIIQFARELDPTLMDTPYQVQSQLPLLVAGTVTKKVTFKGGKTAARGTKKTTMQKTISSAQLTAAVQRSLYARMPKGPLQGPPLSDEILTNRTGRFVRSVMTEVRGNLIRYYYNPIYEVHQNTSRNPNETIEGSIRNITQRRVGRQFNVLKGN